MLRKLVAVAVVDLMVAIVMVLSGSFIVVEARVVVYFAEMHKLTIVVLLFDWLVLAMVKVGVQKVLVRRQSCCLWMLISDCIVGCFK